MIGVRVTDIEIDHAHVTQRVRAGEVRALRKIGFTTRAKAIVSIGPGRGSSRPGSPPTSHLGLIGRFMRYAVDAQHLSVVIGPERLNRKSQNVLSALEKGGNSITTKGRTIRIAARPTMVPALVEACRLLPNFLTDSVSESPAN